uniref:Cytochrome c biogenesis protein Ccs1 n=1 Tax=Bostrychia tenella TaxID=324755 RepID=A0A1Z1M5G4_9FLOR|nr:cytochrome c biogenesis protein ccs1 [Bostrychia tenella]ARW61172.1 cytochrome c biogenesis protein ccs1 [Bostrychia tenella]
MKFLILKNLLWSFLKKLANLNFSIFILLFITIFSILGSLIEQDQSLSYYKTYYPISGSKFFTITWRWIYFFGLDHVYQTWWFILTLVIFMLSLTVCTFSTQLPSFKNARRWKFMFYTQSKNHKYSFSENNSLYCNSLTNIVYSLIISNFFIFHKKHSIYAYKGLYGRIAPLFVHFGIIIILLGSIVSFFSGFVSQEMIPSGEIFHVKNIVHSGFYSKLPIDLYGRIENFDISYNTNNSIKQFFSKISLFYRSRKVVKSKIISVNFPLVFRNIAFYQTDWQINALRIKLGFNKLIQKKLIKANINNKSCWLCNLPINEGKQIFFVLFDLDNSIFLCSSSGIILNKVSVHENFYINNVSVSVKNLIVSTGLQIKIDLGIYVVYLGFFIVIVSTSFSYLSYSQIWVYIGSQNLQLMGSTNRAILFFEEDISTINFYYNYYTSNLNVELDDLFDKILR